MTATATPAQISYLVALMREVPAYDEQMIADFTRSISKEQASDAISKLKAAGYRTARERRQTRSHRSSRRQTRRSWTPRDHEDCLTFGPCGPSCEYAR